MHKHSTMNGEVFLEGDYIGLGINPGGCLGTASNAPAGFTTDLSEADSRLVRVGLMSKLPGLVKEIILRGTVIEGWVLAYNDKQVRSVYRNGKRDLVNVPQNTSTETRLSASWGGMTADRVEVFQTMDFAACDKAVTVRVTIVNLSDKDLEDVRYARFLDPDPDASFLTRNRIAKPGYVAASPSKAPQYSVFLGSDDPRAVVAALPFGDKFDARDTAIWSRSMSSGDTTLALAFNIGRLPAGELARLVFHFGVTDEADKTLGELTSAPAPSEPTPPAPEPAPEPVPAPTAPPADEPVPEPPAPVPAPPAPAKRKVTAKAIIPVGKDGVTIKLTADGIKKYGIKEGAKAPKAGTVLVKASEAVVDGGYSYEIKV